MEAEQRKRKRRHDTQARKHTSTQASRYPGIQNTYSMCGEGPSRTTWQHVPLNAHMHSTWNTGGFHSMNNKLAVCVSEFKLIKRRELHCWRGETQREPRRNPPTQIDTMAGYRMLEPYLDKCGRIGNVILQTLKKKGKGNTRVLKERVEFRGKGLEFTQ